MIDVKTMDLLKAFYEANSYLFDVVDVTTFKEIRRDGTIKIRESFRAHIAKTDSRALMTKDDTSILMGIADAHELQMVYWRRESHPYVYEMRFFPKETLHLVSEQLTNVVAYGEETFDFYQEDGAFLALLADVKTSIKELSTLPGGVSNNNSGKIRDAIQNFVFQFENRIEVWQTTYPNWHKLFREANRELYASAQISTPYDFLRMIIS